MLKIIKKHLGTIVVAMVTAMVTAGAPAIAHGVNHALFAHDADKVDGKHAVGAGTTVTERRGKVVATNSTTGLLPNNIIAKAPDAAHADQADNSADAAHADQADNSADVQCSGCVGPADLASAGWQVPQFNATFLWQNIDINHQTAAYFKDSFGVVHLKGVVQSIFDETIPSETTIFQLPAGYRPAARSVHPTLMNNAIGRINVDADGKVATGVSVPVNGWISLDGISFPSNQP